MSEPPLSERDGCTKLIIPAVERAGWDVQGQIRHHMGDGTQQALEYADMLGVPFAFSSNSSGLRNVAQVEHMMRLCDALRRREDRATKLAEAVVHEMVA